MHKKKRKISSLPSQEGEEDSWLGRVFCKIWEVTKEGDGDEEGVMRKISHEERER